MFMCLTNSYLVLTTQTFADYFHCITNRTRDSHKLRPTFRWTNSIFSSFFFEELTFCFKNSALVYVYMSQVAKPKFGKFEQKDFYCHNDVVMVKIWSEKEGERESIPSWIVTARIYRLVKKRNECYRGRKASFDRFDSEYLITFFVCILCSIAF